MYIDFDAILCDSYLQIVIFFSIVIFITIFIFGLFSSLGLGVAQLGMDVKCMAYCKVWEWGSYGCVWRRKVWVWLRKVWVWLRKVWVWLRKVWVWLRKVCVT